MSCLFSSYCNSDIDFQGTWFTNARIGNHLLLYHQIPPFLYMHPDTPYRSLILYQDVGFGKTYVAAAIAFEYLDRGRDVYFIALNDCSRIAFTVEFSKYTYNRQGRDYIKHIRIMGLLEAKNKMSALVDNALYIFDEAHNLRSDTKKFGDLKMHMAGLNKARILMMTGTLAVNENSNLDDLLNFIPGTPVMRQNTPIEEGQYGVNVTDVNHRVEMSDDQTSKLRKMYESGFRIKERLVELSCCSSADDFEDTSPKMKAVLGNISNTVCKSVIYCEFIKDNGVVGIARTLDKHGFKEWDPSKTRSSKKRFYAICRPENASTTIQAFNSLTNIRGDSIEILILSKASSESISLQCVRALHLMTGFWNEARMKQCIGRCVRMYSHDSLPPSERELIIHHYTAILPGHETADQTMDRVSVIKQTHIDEAIARLDLLTLDVETDITDPKPDGHYILEHGGKMWNIEECLSSNRYSFSFAKFRADKAKCWVDGRWVVHPFHCVTLFEPERSSVGPWFMVCLDNIVRFKNSGTRRWREVRTLDIKVLHNACKFFGIEYTDLYKSQIIDVLLDTAKQKNRYVSKQLVTVCECGQ